MEKVKDVALYAICAVGIVVGLAIQFSVATALTVRDAFKGVLGFGQFKRLEDELGFINFTKKVFKGDI